MPAPLRTLTRWLRVITPALCLALAAPHAAAQPAVDPDDLLAALSVTVVPSEEDREAIAALIEPLEAEATEVRHAYSRDIQRLREKQRFTREDQIKRYNEREEKIEALVDRFWDDFAIILPPEHLHHMRTIRLRTERISEITASNLSYYGPHTIDPTVIAFDLGLPHTLDDEDRAAFEEAMARYDRLTARAIRRSARAEDEMWDYALSVPVIDHRDPDMIDKFQDIVDASARVRRVHRSCSREIERTLPDSVRDQWHAIELRMRYPEVARPHWCEEHLDPLTRHPELTGSERQALRELAATMSQSIKQNRERERNELDDQLEDKTAAQLMHEYDEGPEPTDAWRDQLATHAHREALAIIAPERHHLVPAYPLPEEDDTEDSDDTDSDSG